MVDIKKTLMKALVVAGAGAITALIGWLQIIAVDPSQTIWATLGIAALTSIQDIIKHWKD